VAGVDQQGILEVMRRTAADIPQQPRRPRHASARGLLSPARGSREAPV